VSKEKLIGLIKFVKSDERADDLLNGELSSSKVSKFKEKDDGSFLVGDKHEGASIWLQPNTFTMTISNEFLGEHEITGFIGATTFSTSEVEDLYVYCMSSLTTADCDDDDYNKCRSDDSVIELIKRIIREKFDPRIWEFGHYAVLVFNVNQFFERIQKANKKYCLNVKGKKVEYIDENKQHYLPSDNDVLFVKRSGYDYQREYRLLFDFEDSKDRNSFDIGNIRDIACKIKYENL